MPATALTNISVTRNVSNGVDLTTGLVAVDGTNGNSFANDGNAVLRVKNGNAAATVVTVWFQGTQTPAVDGVTLSGASGGKTYTVPATTGDRLIGPFPTSTYGTTVQVTFSISATVTAAVYDLSN